MKLHNFIFFLIPLFLNSCSSVKNSQIISGQNEFPAITESDVSIENIINSMTIEEKVAQLFIIRPEQLDPSISQEEMHNFIESPICSYPERLKEPKHPTQKPISILKKMIQIASNPNDIVFDPFMGVGSTGVAALALDRRFIGIEKEKDYYIAAKQRIDEEYNKTIQEKSSHSKQYIFDIEERGNMVCEDDPFECSYRRELDYFFSK